MDYIPDDGWVRTDGFIVGTKPNAAGERIHGDLAFSYRPATPREGKQIDAKVLRASYEPDDIETMKSEAIVTDFAASKITEWDLKDRGGHPVPCTEKTIQSMHPLLFSKLYNIIRGLALSDKKPDDTKEPLSNGELMGNSVAASA